MRANFCLFIFILLFSCGQTYNTDNEETQFLNDFVEDDTTIEKTPLKTIKINTDAGREIVDEPKISAFLQIFQGENLIEEHNIGIEIRGSSSQYFPKKSYGFETWDEAGEDLDVSLAGYPEEEDWILYGPFSDKSLIRNVLIYRLSNLVGRYATKTSFYNLQINGVFLGLYVLMEKIKRDKNRVNISKNRSDDISGGYIIKIDKITGDGDTLNEKIAFMSEYTKDGVKGINKNVHFLYEYPKNRDISNEQKNYIQAYMRDFEDAIASENFTSESDGYKKYIDVDSFIDFFILNEITRNVDAYRISTFMHKDINEKLKMGPIWDFNIAFGNADYCEGGLTTGWAYKFNEACPADGMLVPFWWDRLMQDPNFTQALEKRWTSLRLNELSNSSIMGIIDELVGELEDSDAITQNFGKWLILGTYIWPNNFVGNRHSEEITYLKEWIEDRLSWMDQEISKL